MTFRLSDDFYLCISFSTSMTPTGPCFETFNQIFDIQSFVGLCEVMAAPRTALTAVLCAFLFYGYEAMQIQMPEASALKESDLSEQFHALQENVTELWTYIRQLRNSVNGHLNHLKHHQEDLEMAIQKLNYAHEGVIGIESSPHSESDGHHHSAEHSSDHHHSGEHSDDHHHSGEHKHDHDHYSESHSHSDDHSHGGDHSHSDDHSHGGDHSHGDDHSHSSDHSHSDDHGHSHSSDHGSDDHHSHHTSTHKDSHEDESIQQLSQKETGPLVEPLVVPVTTPRHVHPVPPNATTDHHRHHSHSTSYRSSSFIRNRTRVVVVPKYSEYDLYNFGSCTIQPNRVIPIEQRQEITGTVSFWQKKIGGPLNIHVRLQGFQMGDDHAHEQQIVQSVSVEDESQPMSHKHGMHVHALGDLSYGCDSTGPHYNPSGVTHEGPKSLVRHVGDFGNIECDDKGTANILFSDEVASLKGPYSILGKALVIHEKEDDLGLGDNDESLRTGNAGRRVACCVIEKVDKLPMRTHKAIVLAKQYKNY